MTKALRLPEDRNERADQASPVSNGDVTFYTVSDARYFVGTVSLLNSIRLMGHDNGVVVLDCGFTPRQRDVLRPHCKLVELSRDLVANPCLFKPFAYLLNPKGTVVIVDSDMIITRSLEPIVALARHGRICAFPDPDSQRWFGEWQRLFALTREPRRQTYVNSGFVVFSTSHWPDLLAQWWRACERIWSHPTIAEGVPKTEPSAQADQDALNALLMSEVPIEALAVQPQEEAPLSKAMGALWDGVQVVDTVTLACRYRGHATTLLHSTRNPKPWQTGGWQQVRRTAYVRLLPRLLLGADVALRVRPEELPIWLRTGVTAQLAIHGLDLLNTTKREVQKRRRWVVRRLREHLGPSRFNNQKLEKR